MEIEEKSKIKYTYIKDIAERIIREYKEKYRGEKCLPEPSEQTCMAYEIINLLQEREQDKKRIQELENRIDKLAVEMKENGTHYWARRLDNIKEEK